MFTSVCYWYLSWIIWTWSTSYHSVFLRSILILLSHVFSGLPNDLFPSCLTTKIYFIISPICATCPAHLILLDLITQIIFGKEFKRWISSLHTFSSLLFFHAFEVQIFAATTPYSKGLDFWTRCFVFSMFCFLSWSERAVWHWYLQNNVVLST
jgi:hypothetical protein